MAKRYFQSWFFRAKHFASGLFAGVGVDAVGTTGWFAKRPPEREVVWKALPRQRGVVWTGGTVNGSIHRDATRHVVWKAQQR